MKLFTKLLRKHQMPMIAFVVAIISMILTPLDEAYLNYIDWSTILTLYVMMAILQAFHHIHIFEIISKLIVRRVVHTRRAVFIIVLTTYIASMFIANDMALLTFLPLTLLVFKYAQKEKFIAITIILQTIAANLGGMLTPFGNPQNLYIYNYYQIPGLEFMAIMFIPFVISSTTIVITLLFIRKEPMQDMQIQLFEGSPKDFEELPTHEIQKDSLPTIELAVGPTILYSVLFVLAILMVFRVIPIAVVTFIIIGVMVFSDRKSLIQIDWDLLMTFILFFVASSNFSRVSLLQEALSGLIGSSTYLTSVISCQFISNVPSAILLSQFTTNYIDLLRGVNIGGVGTLISSLASLIALRHFIHDYPNQKWYYIRLFSLINFAFLISLSLIIVFFL